MRVLIITTKEQHKNLNNHPRKLTYAQTKPNKTKAWLKGLLYAILPVNHSGPFCSSRGV